MRYDFGIINRGLICSGWALRNIVNAADGKSLFYWL